MQTRLSNYAILFDQFTPVQGGGANTGIYKRAISSLQASFSDLSVLRDWILFVTPTLPLAHVSVPVIRPILLLITPPTLGPQSSSGGLLTTYFCLYLPSSSHHTNERGSMAVADSVSTRAEKVISVLFSNNQLWTTLFSQKKYLFKVY